MIEEDSGGQKSLNQKGDNDLLGLGISHQSVSLSTINSSKIDTFKLRSKLWMSSLSRLRRAIDEVYALCEFESDVVCVEKVSKLIKVAEHDFHQLEQRLRLQKSALNGIQSDLPNVNKFKSHAWQIRPMHGIPKKSDESFDMENALCRLQSPNGKSFDKHDTNIIENAEIQAEISAVKSSDAPNTYSACSIPTDHTNKNAEEVTGQVLSSSNPQNIILNVKNSNKQEKCMTSEGPQPTSSIFPNKKFGGVSKSSDVSQDIQNTIIQSLPSVLVDISGDVQQDAAFIYDSSKQHSSSIKNLKESFPNSQSMSSSNPISSKHNSKLSGSLKSKISDENPRHILDDESKTISPTKKRRILVPSAPATTKKIVSTKRADDAHKVSNMLSSELKRDATIDITISQDTSPVMLMSCILSASSFSDPDAPRPPSLLVSKDSQLVSSEDPLSSMSKHFLSSSTALTLNPNSANSTFLASTTTSNMAAVPGTSTETLTKISGGDRNPLISQRMMNIQGGANYDSPQYPPQYYPPSCRADVTKSQFFSDPSYSGYLPIINHMSSHNYELGNMPYYYNMNAAAISNTNASSSRLHTNNFAPYFNSNGNKTDFVHGRVDLCRFSDDRSTYLNNGHLTTSNFNSPHVYDTNDFIDWSSHNRGQAFDYFGHNSSNILNQTANAGLFMYNDVNVQNLGHHSVNDTFNTTPTSNNHFLSDSILSINNNNIRNTIEFSSSINLNENHGFNTDVSFNKATDKHYSTFQNNKDSIYADCYDSSHYDEIAKSGNQNIPSYFGNNNNCIDGGSPSPFQADLILFPINQTNNNNIRNNLNQFNNSTIATSPNRNYDNQLLLSEIAKSGVKSCEDSTSSSSTSSHVPSSNHHVSAAAFGVSNNSNNNNGTILPHSKSVNKLGTNLHNSNDILAHKTANMLNLDLTFLNNRNNLKINDNNQIIYNTQNSGNVSIHNASDQILVSTSNPSTTTHSSNSQNGVVIDNFGHAISNSSNSIAMQQCVEPGHPSSMSHSNNNPKQYVIQKDINNISGGALNIMDSNQHFPAPSIHTANNNNSSNNGDFFNNSNNVLKADENDNSISLTIPSEINNQPSFSDTNNIYYELPTYQSHVNHHHHHQQQQQQVPFNYYPSSYSYSNAISADNNNNNNSNNNNLHSTAGMINNCVHPPPTPTSFDAFQQQIQGISSHAAAGADYLPGALAYPTAWDLSLMDPYGGYYFSGNGLDLDLDEDDYILRSMLLDDLLLILDDLPNTPPPRPLSSLEDEDYQGYSLNQIKNKNLTNNGGVHDAKTEFVNTFSHGEGNNKNVSTGPNSTEKVIGSSRHPNLANSAYEMGETNIDDEVTEEMARIRAVVARFAFDHQNIPFRNRTGTESPKNSKVSSQSGSAGANQNTGKNCSASPVTRRTGDANICPDSIVRSHDHSNTGSNSRSATLNSFNRNSNSNSNNNSISITKKTSNSPFRSVHSPTRPAETHSNLVQLDTSSVEERVRTARDRREAVRAEREHTLLTKLARARIQYADNLRCIMQRAKKDTSRIAEVSYQQKEAREQTKAMLELRLWKAETLKLAREDQIRKRLFDRAEAIKETVENLKEKAADEIVRKRELLDEKVRKAESRRLAHLEFIRSKNQDGIRVSGTPSPVRKELSPATECHLISSSLHNSPSRAASPVYIRDDLSSSPPHTPIVVSSSMMMTPGKHVLHDQLATGINVAGVSLRELESSPSIGIGATQTTNSTHHHQTLHNAQLGTHNSSVITLRNDAMKALGLESDEATLMADLVDEFRALNVPYNTNINSATQPPHIVHNAVRTSSAQNVFSFSNNNNNSSAVEHPSNCVNISDSASISPLSFIDDANHTSCMKTSFRMKCNRPPPLVFQASPEHPVKSTSVISSGKYNDANRRMHMLSKQKQTDAADTSSLPFSKVLTQLPTLPQLDAKLASTDFPLVATPSSPIVDSLLGANYPPTPQSHLRTHLETLEMSDGEGDRQSIHSAPPAFMGFTSPHFPLSDAEQERKSFLFHSCQGTDDICSELGVPPQNLNDIAGNEHVDFCAFNSAQHTIDSNTLTHVVVLDNHEHLSISDHHHVLAGVNPNLDISAFQPSLQVSQAHQLTQNEPARQQLAVSAHALLQTALVDYPQASNSHCMAASPSNVSIHPSHSVSFPPSLQTPSNTIITPPPLNNHPEFTPTTTTLNAPLFVQPWSFFPAQPPPIPPAYLPFHPVFCQPSLFAPPPPHPWSSHHAQQPPGGLAADGHPPDHHGSQMFASVSSSPQHPLSTPRLFNNSTLPTPSCLTPPHVSPPPPPSTLELSLQPAPSAEYVCLNYTPSTPELPPPASNECPSWIEHLTTHHQLSSQPTKLVPSFSTSRVAPPRASNSSSLTKRSHVLPRPPIHSIVNLKSQSKNNTSSVSHLILSTTANRPLLQNSNACSQQETSDKSKQNTWRPVGPCRSSSSNHLAVVPSSNHAPPSVLSLTQQQKRKKTNTAFVQALQAFDQNVKISIPSSRRPCGWSRLKRNRSVSCASLGDRLDLAIPVRSESSIMKSGCKGNDDFKQYLSLINLQKLKKGNSKSSSGILNMPSTDKKSLKNNVCTIESGQVQHHNQQVQTNTEIQSVRFMPNVACDNLARRQFWIWREQVEVITEHFGGISISKLLSVFHLKPSPVTRAMRLRLIKIAKTLTLIQSAESIVSALKEISKILNASSLESSDSIVHALLTSGVDGRLWTLVALLRPGTSSKLCSPSETREILLNVFKIFSSCSSRSPFIWSIMALLRGHAYTLVDLATELLERASSYTELSPPPIYRVLSKEYRKLHTHGKEQQVKLDDLPEQDSDSSSSLSGFNRVYLDEKAPKTWNSKSIRNYTTLVPLSVISSSAPPQTSFTLCLASTDKCASSCSTDSSLSSTQMNNLSPLFAPLDNNVYSMDETWSEIISSGIGSSVLLPAVLVLLASIASTAAIPPSPLSSNLAVDTSLSTVQHDSSFEDEIDVNSTKNTKNTKKTKVNNRKKENQQVDAFDFLPSGLSWPPSFLVGNSLNAIQSTADYESQSFSASSINKNKTLEHLWRFIVFLRERFVIEALAGGLSTRLASRFMTLRSVAEGFKNPDSALTPLALVRGSQLLGILSGLKIRAFRTQQPSMFDCEPLAVNLQFADNFETPETSAIMLEARRTEAFGCISLMASLLFASGMSSHSGGANDSLLIFGASHKLDKASRIPQASLTITLEALRTVNNIARLHLPSLAGIVDAPVCALRQSLSYLLDYCSRHSSSCNGSVPSDEAQKASPSDPYRRPLLSTEIALVKSLLPETLFVLSWLPTLHPDTLASMRFGGSCSVLSRLASLPLEFWTSPSLKSLLFPTLACLVFLDSNNRATLMADCSLLTTYKYLQHFLEKRSSPTRNLFAVDNISLLSIKQRQPDGHSLYNSSSVTSGSTDEGTFDASGWSPPSFPSPSLVKREGGASFSAVYGNPNGERPWWANVFARMPLPWIERAVEMLKPENEGKIQR